MGAMTKPNPWKAPQFTGPAFGGPLAGSNIEHDMDRKEIFVLGEEIGFYVFDEDKWLWSPKDAMPARSLG